MWARIWLVVTVSSIGKTQLPPTTQETSTGFEWGWQLSPVDGGGSGATVGHYYIKLPDTEQSVKYAADDSGYHGAISVTTSGDHHTSTASFALGERAIQLSGNQLSTQFPTPFNTTSLDQSDLVTNTAQTPLDIYLLQHQYLTSTINNQLQTLPVTVATSDIQYTPYPETNTFEYVSTNYDDEKELDGRRNTKNLRTNEIPSSTPLPQEDVSNEPLKAFSGEVVQIFKDHNCTTEETATKNVNKYQKSQLTVDTPKYKFENINGNFGAKEPLTYRGSINFKVEKPRDNARSERYYYNSVSSTTKDPFYEGNDGFYKLVGLTQDLISNEDLLRINHAAEKPAPPNYDDLLKPRPKFSFKNQDKKFNRYYSNNNVPKSRITLKAKIGNIVDSEIEHVKNNEAKEQGLQTSSNEYRFSAPIVVQDLPYEGYKEQIVTNLVSTMVPYLQEGYEIVGVKETFNQTSHYDSDNNLVHVTPRPVGQKYLAPITVALRLINANDSLDFNTLDDTETSDSEVVTRTVAKPVHEKILVEVQQSEPVSITHINDVEVHEYMDEGRVNNNKSPFDVAKALYNEYMDSIKHSNQQNNEENQEQKHDSSENIETSANNQAEVHIQPNEGNKARSEYVQYYNDYNNDQQTYNSEQQQINDDQQKIIQPIIIEKQVPITHFVDRYIEKQVPYPEPVEVVQQVPIDRPVPVPYEKIVEKPYEVTRYVDKPYPVEVHLPYPVPINVPYPVEQTVYVDRPIHIPYPVEKVIEKQVYHQVPVPTPVGVPVEVPVPVEQKVLYPFPVDRPYGVPVPVEKPVERIVTKNVPYPVETKVPYPVPVEHKVPVPYLVEKRVPFDRIVEKPVTITKVVEKPVHVPVPQPYPVDRIVEKRIPYPVHVEKVVEKKVPVKVPYPVEKVVEKIVEKPVVVTKYIDKPYPVEKPMPYPVEKIVEKRIPYAVHIPIPIEKIVERPSQNTNPQSHLKVPYHDRQVPYYGYGFLHDPQQSQKIPQYTKYFLEQHKNLPPQIQNHHHLKQPYQNQVPQGYAANYLQYIRDKQANNPQNVITTIWGNQYASAYQQIKDPQHQQSYKPNQQNYDSNISKEQYYGPPPLENSRSEWEQMGSLHREFEKRNDRTPKNVKMEYGFKPPLRPSTEIDLDGMPIKKNET